jgi:signal transduction histidine kinase
VPLPEPDDCCQAVIDALPFYVIIVDADHRIVAANDEAVQALKLEHAQVCGSFCPRTVHGRDAFPGCPLEAAVALQAPVENEVWDEDHRKWIRACMYPLRLKAPDGRGLYLHFSRDITTEHQAAEAVAQSLEHQKALVELLRRLQGVDSEHQAIQELFDLASTRSWMGGAIRAAGYRVGAGRLERVTCRGLTAEEEAGCGRRATGQCVCDEVVRTQRSVVATAAELRERLPDHGWPLQHGHVTLPLVHEGRTVGVLNFYLDAGMSLTPDQLAFLEAAAGVTSQAIDQIRARTEARQAREESAALERRLLERTLASQEEERRRLSRELHDDLGQSLSALLLEVRAREPVDTRCAEMQDRLSAQIKEIIGKVSALAYDLRPSILDDYGLPSALERFIERLALRWARPIDFQHVPAPDGVPRLPSDVEIVLYRLTQESLHNVVRHSGATRASVVLFHQRHEVTLLVEDDGQGFDVTEAWRGQGQRSLGLMGMRERVGLLHGVFLLESRPGQGTTVKVTIPLDGERGKGP